MEKLKEEIEASKTVEDKWVIDQFLSRASIDISHKYELYKELTNRACEAFSTEDEEYEHVVHVIKEYRELEKFYEEINCYTYFLTHSIYDGVMQEWFDKNCVFADDCYYLHHLISEREELENGFSTDSRISKMEDQFCKAYDDFKRETLARIRSYLEKKEDEIYKKLENLLLKEKEGITVPEQQLKAVVEEEYVKIKEDIVDEIAEIEY